MEFGFLLPLAGDIYFVIIFRLGAGLKLSS
ncbi:hypothetical protein PEPS_13240 [Persicobacter psychrovividus]|uniref:Uncharacterized protein n=1 Tax=Persicobacter psychrovividus TaxID=387638 RepID=A0ABM7VDL8_9BACT|nr:hypothetical protein PEPS_13240 [Persicobacter psychrovividus]